MSGTEALKSPSPTDILLEIIGHLGAAISQSLPSDDAIIMEHVRGAHDLATLLYRAQSGRSPMRAAP